MTVFEAERELAQVAKRLRGSPDWDAFVAALDAVSKACMAELMSAPAGSLTASQAKAQMAARLASVLGDPVQFDKGKR